MPDIIHPELRSNVPVYYASSITLVKGFRNITFSTGDKTKNTCGTITEVQLAIPRSITYPTKQHLNRKKI
jgi:hypothetical protein